MVAIELAPEIGKNGCAYAWIAVLSERPERHTSLCDSSCRYSAGCRGFGSDNCQLTERIIRPARQVSKPAQLKDLAIISELTMPLEKWYFTL